MQPQPTESPPTEADKGARARRLLRVCRGGTLSTLSVRHAGYPFGSVVPFILDHAARPVLLVSRLAEHTRNMQADPRVSLLAREDGADLQAGARVTVIGRASPLSSGEDAVAARWLRYFPDAGELLALGDFSFWRIEPEGARYIAGFGAIHWIAAAALRAPANTLADAEEGIVAHMNADHAHNLRDYARALHDVDAEARMAGVDCEGFDLRVPERLLRVDFAAPAADAQAVRDELVRLAERCRARQ